MLEGKNNLKAWLYLAPALVLLGLFSFYPIVNSFILAFVRDYHPVSARFAELRALNKEAGLSYFTFQNLLSVFKNTHFKDAIINTLLIAAVSVPSSVVLSLFISVLLVSIKKIRGFFQTLFFLPYVTSAMAVSMAFTVLFANSGSNVSKVSMGPVNTVVKAVGLEKALITSLDKAEWNRKGKKLWYAYIGADSKGNVSEEEKESKYQAYLYQKMFDYTNSMPSYANADEYYQKAILDSPDYAMIEYKYRHHFKTLGYDTSNPESMGCTIEEYDGGYIDWVGANSTWNTQIVIVLVYSIWAGMAFKIMVFTGGLTGIDKQYYDAAKIDATSKWRTFWRITVPMMSPLIVYILITSLIGSFKTYTSIVGLFGDKMGPASQPYSMVTFVGMVYQYMNQGNELIHLGAAAAVILFFIVLVVTEITNKFTRKRVHY